MPSFKCLPKSPLALSLEAVSRVMISLGPKKPFKRTRPRGGVHNPTLDTQKGLSNECSRPDVEQMCAQGTRVAPRKEHMASMHANKTCHLPGAASRHRDHTDGCSSHVDWEACKGAGGKRDTLAHTRAEFWIGEPPVSNFDFPLDVFATIFPSSIFLSCFYPHCHTLSLSIKFLSPSTLLNS